ncbi:MAG: histidinol-phosphate transaminase [Chitinophagales bacterium]|nr:histidinol-phosphate transaminase [Chitinophagales bacterium]
MKDIEALVRTNIQQLKPYSSARDEFKGEASVYLDANENSFGSPVTLPDGEGLNRYPDPLQQKLKEKISSIKGVPPQNIFLGNGSDEAIDLLFRIFCEPGKDAVIICPPTYGMYEVSANINNVSVINISLLPSFDLDVEKLLETFSPSAKLLFICSPNNPTANSFHADDVELLIHKFPGIVVIDEAYINYSKQKSAIRWLTEYDNLVVLQTFSKAWGMAALRLGMAFASETIIDYFNKVKPPYNVNEATQQLALAALDNMMWVNEHIRKTVALREELIRQLQLVSFVEKIYPSDANFILAKMKDPSAVYTHLAAHGIIVRNRSKVQLCEGCLRITVGTAAENEALITTLKIYQA